jgi:hypothetical protein
MLFEEAVQNVVRTNTDLLLLEKLDSFSAHDITRQVRNEIHNVDITDRVKEDVDVSGYTVNTVRVDHDEVKEIVHAFMVKQMDDGILVKRTTNGTHWVYEKVKQVQNVTQTDDNKNDGDSTDAPKAQTKGKYDGAPSILNKLPTWSAIKQKLGM